MDPVSRSTGPQTIRFALSSRILTDGRVALTLQLFRGTNPVLTKLLATVDRREAVSVAFESRRHLEKLGIEAIVESSVVAVPIRAMKPGDPRPGLPPAASLHQALRAR